MLKLEKVIPIGRRLVEYKGMFKISDKEIQESKIVDCGGGPSSFNAEASAMGGEVVSIDPIYQFTPTQIKGRVNETFDPMFEQIKGKQEMFVWNHVKSVDELISYRQSAIDLYLGDFVGGKKEGRYLFETLPTTTFKKAQFDLALCSHFLFLYSEHLTLTFHLSSIKEMLRIANTVKIFPVIGLDGKESPHLSEVIEVLTEQGYKAQLRDADYEFLKGANQYLQVSRK